MKTSALLASLLVVMLLGACASSRPRFQDFADPSAAKLTIKTTSTDHFNIHVVSLSGEEYLQSRGEVITLLNSKAIGFDFSDRKTIKVQPGTEFRFLTLAGDHEFVGIDKIRSRACITHTAFKPIAGATYIATHELLPSGCRVTIQRDERGNLLDEPSAKQLPACLDPSLGGAAYDTACKEGFRFR